MDDIVEGYSFTDALIYQFEYNFEKLREVLLATDQNVCDGLKAIHEEEIERLRDQIQQPAMVTNSN